MSKRLEKTWLKFITFFQYSPSFPNEIDFDQNTYAELLDKCIADNFDYTIKMYGTIPGKSEGLPEIIYD